MNGKALKEPVVARSVRSGAMQIRAVQIRAVQIVGLRSKARRLRSTEAGFTLVEMMAVVIIVSVLAMLAVYGVRKYIQAAKSSEAYSMISDIKAAEESYRGETFKYLGDVGFNNWHPVTTPGNFKTSWNVKNGVASDNFRTLGVVSDTAVYFTYEVAAGASGDPLPTPPTLQTFDFPAQSQPFYIVVAKGDLDGDGTVYSYFVAPSWTSDIFLENEGE